MLDKKSLVSLCVASADAIANSNGFVSMAALAHKLGVCVKFRPLLVEAMLGVTKLTKNGEDQWLILVDDEKHPNLTERFELETSESALPPRIRNTIAHELVHSVSFKPTKDGIKFSSGKDANLSSLREIKKIETATEDLSPLLLVPYRAVRDAFLNSQLSIETLLNIRSNCAVSREVVIQRLRQLSSHDPSNIRFSTTPKEVFIGLGEWTVSGAAKLLWWPSWSNLSANSVFPALVRLKNEEFLSSTEFTSDFSFYLNGGANNRTQLSYKDPRRGFQYLDVDFEFSVERVEKFSGNRFFFLLKRIFDVRLK